MSHLTRIALSPDDESDYENTNRNMSDLDPEYNCITSNNVTNVLKPNTTLTMTLIMSQKIIITMLRGLL